LLGGRPAAPHVQERLQPLLGVCLAVRQAQPV